VSAGGLGFQGLTIDGGGTHAGVNVTAGAAFGSDDITLRNCVSGSGPALTADGAATLSITSSRFDSNSAVGSDGGAMALSASVTASLQTTTFSSNQARRGGALSISGSAVTLQQVRGWDQVHWVCMYVYMYVCVVPIKATDNT